MKPLAPYTGPKIRRIGESWAIGEDDSVYAETALFKEPTEGFHRVSKLQGIEELFVGGGAHCARFRDQVIRCWGENADAGLGKLGGCAKTFERYSDPDLEELRRVRVWCDTPVELPWARGARFADPSNHTSCFGVGNELRCTGQLAKIISGAESCPRRVGGSGVREEVCPPTTVDVGHPIRRSDANFVLTEDGLFGEVKNRALLIQQKKVRAVQYDRRTFLFEDGTVKTDGRLLPLPEVNQITSTSVSWCRTTSGRIEASGSTGCKVRSGPSDTCGLAKDGRVFCVDGVFGEGPVEISGLGKVVQLVQGMALNDAGGVYRLARDVPPSGPTPLELR